jgi:hypothetical protein
MANDTTLNTPVLWINKYLQTKLGQDVGIGVPFFPSMPSTIDALTESWITIAPDFDENGELTSQSQRIAFSGVMSTWDRMFRMNRKPFPHIKTEQILYYFYATQENSIPQMIRTTEEIFRLLDRGDESAEEINNWCSNRRVNLKLPETPEDDPDNFIENMFYFHDFKVYQLEEVRDIIDFGTARTYAGNKIIIDFDYHQMPELTNNAWRPEPKLSRDNKITI